MIRRASASASAIVFASVYTRMIGSVFDLHHYFLSYFEGVGYSSILVKVGKQGCFADGGQLLFVA